MSRKNGGKFLLMFLSLNCITRARQALRLRAIILILILILILARVTLRLRTTSLLGEDSCCRGGIVHIRGGCSRALLVRPNSSTALWRFRVSTSNSPSGRSWPPTHTPIRYIIILTLNKIFEYVEMTILSRPSGSIPIPRRFAFFA